MKSIFLLIALLFIGCSSSLVYSPSLQLDKNQPEKEEVTLSGNLTLLPETRPYSLTFPGLEVEQGDRTSIGLDGRIGYGFSESFNLEGRGWIDIDRVSGKRGGLAIASSYYFNDDEKLSYFLKPAVGIVIDNGQYEGLGFEVPAGIVYDFNERFYNYTGVGLAYGARSTSIQENGNREIGFGFIGHFGFGYLLNDIVSVRAEFTPIQQINMYDETEPFIMSATIGLSLSL
ncbi:MAG: hypothetical protein ACE364_06880 [Chlorobiota bacterium]